MILRKDVPSGSENPLCYIPRSIKERELTATAVLPVAAGTEGTLGVITVLEKENDPFRGLSSYL